MGGGGERWDGMSRQRRGVVVPTLFCLLSPLLLNGWIKEKTGRVVIFELSRHRRTNSQPGSAGVPVCAAKRSHRHP